MARVRIQPATEGGKVLAGDGDGYRLQEQAAQAEGQALVAGRFAPVAATVSRFAAATALVRAE